MPDNDPQAREQAERRQAEEQERRAREDESRARERERYGSAKWDLRQARWQAKWDRRQARWEARQARWGSGAPYHGKHAMGGLFFGIILTTIGVLFLLQNLGIRFFDNVWDFWPVILIVLGASRIASSYGWGGRVWGGMLVLIGGVFLLENLDILPYVRWGQFWPVILVGVGISMLVKNIERQHATRRTDAAGSAAGSPGGPGGCPTVGGRSSGVTSSSTLNEWAVFSGVRRKVDSQEFEGGEVTAVFGGAEIDLRGAAMKKDEAIIDVNAVFGGVEIHAPDNWEVVMSGTPIFGGYDDDTHPPRATGDEKRPRLIISGSAVFGGVTVKN